MRFNEINTKSGEDMEKCHSESDNVYAGDNAHCRLQAMIGSLPNPTAIFTSATRKHGDNMHCRIREKIWR